MRTLPEKNLIEPDQLRGDPNESIVEQLNRKHAVIMLGGRCLVLNQIINPVTKQPDINFSSLQDFKARYLNKKIPVTRNGQILETTIADVWLESLGRREFSGIVFDPSGKENPGYYNLWRGFAITPKKGNWSRMENHIYKIICNGDSEIFSYLMAWMARIVQFPGGKRPGVVLVLRGKQGTGKGIFVINFGKIFGSHFQQIISHHLVAGRFNSHFKDTLLVFVDEGFWNGDRQAEGILKGMVTEDFISVEPKGKESFAIKNHCNFMFASNSEWIIPASTEERRFFVIDVSENRMGDSAYFRALQNEMDNGGREAMLDYLLHLDISNIDLRKFPRREALLDQITHSWPTAKKFWFESLRAGNFGDSNNWPTEYPTNDFYKLFVNFSIDRGDRYRTTDKMFGKMIRELCPWIERKQKSGGDRYYRLPPLDECREALESALKIKIDWNE
jgi:hypothetical protein